MIDPDATVSANYQRLVFETLDGVYNDSLPDSMSKGELRDRIVGRIRSALKTVFPDLQLEGVGRIGGLEGTSGTFYFTKGESKSFLYKNLSAGEKAVFDLLLDAVIKSEYFDDTIWCIDEPETHLNTRIQAILLQALVDLLPARSQLIVASHSIGFMRKAWEMARDQPGSVVFIDLQDVDFDLPVVLTPVQPSREFWSKTLEVALGDLATLMSPEVVVLCEGRPARDSTDKKGEFDARCYRKIFASEFPDTAFLSVGNSDDVGQDRLGAGQALEAIARGTRVIRLIDRDWMAEEEVAERRRDGLSILSRRNLEAYLLDDEVLSALCTSENRPDLADDAVAIKVREMEASVRRGNDPDDLKKAAAQIYHALRSLLSLTSSGSDWNSFARGVLAPLLQPGMSAYEELKQAIFGS